MIIDLILDRKDGDKYQPSKFYHDCMGYGEVGNDITAAMDYGNEPDIKKAICQYIIDNDYNLDICKYVNRVNWLSSDERSI